MTIGERIKQARKERGLTQKRLGELSGTSEITVRQYEIGKRQPRLEQLRRIADALGVPMSYLLGHTDDPADRSKTHWAEIVDFLDPSLGARLVGAFTELNSDGQQKAVERVEELTEIPRYQATTAPESSPAPPEGQSTTPPPDAPETTSEGE